MICSAIPCLSQTRKTTEPEVFSLGYGVLDPLRANDYKMKMVPLKVHLVLGVCVCVCVCVCVGKCVQQGSHFFQMNFPNLIKSKCKQMGRVNFITETGSSRLTASKFKKKKVTLSLLCSLWKLSL